MQRYKLTVEYLGHAFYGFAPQKLAATPTVQEEIEKSIRKFAGAGNYSAVIGSSRTDAGVHAFANVCHVDLQRRSGRTGLIVEPYSEKDVKNALNSLLSRVPIRILEAKKVSQDFHARFMATERSYIYKILMPQASYKADSQGYRHYPSVFHESRYWCLNYSLDVAAMEQASQHLIGIHNFSSFRASRCKARSPIREISEISFKRDNQSSNSGFLDIENKELLSITVRAPSFLHHMVRNIVGALHEVGRKKLHPDKIQDILYAKCRCKAPPTAPAHGLYLKNVAYE